MWHALPVILAGVRCAWVEKSVKQLHVVLLFPLRVKEAAIPSATDGLHGDERKRETELELQVSEPLSDGQRAAIENWKVAHGRVQTEEIAQVNECASLLHDL